MSSKYVRQTLKTWLPLNTLEARILDLSARFKNLKDELSDEGISRTENWLGIQFIGQSEEPVALSANNTQGKYRETGSFFFHIVEPLGDSATLVTRLEDRAEALRDDLRGQTINGNIRVESVTPPNFEPGASLEFASGYEACTIIVNYERDLSL